MSKPSWDDAPEWANYLAMDDDGAWYWFECMPKPDKWSGEWGAEGREVMASEPNHKWLDTLEPRPESKP